MLTLDQVKALKYDQIIYCVHYKNADGTAQRWRVVSAVKTWKRDPNRIQVSLKRGLKEHYRMTEKDLHEFTLG